MEHVFVVPLMRFEKGMIQYYLPVPAEVAEDLKDRKIRRLITSINGVEVNRAILSTGEGEYYIALNKNLLRDTRVMLGEPVQVVLRPDPNPDRIEICEEFEIVLQQDEAAARRFYGFTTGLQRSLVSYVNGARREETRIKRALLMAKKLRNYELSIDRTADD